jgi:hypothetical protein
VILWSGFKDDVDSFHLDSHSYNSYLIRFIRSLDLKEGNIVGVSSVFVFNGSDSLDILNNRFERKHSLPGHSFSSDTASSEG